MLSLKNIRKSYKTGDFIQHALKGVDLEFRKNEFVAILGPSGSGKTTLLNIIGGLDRYDDGDLIISNKSTKMYKDRDWDAYRNNCIGFVFQSYNLITHISVLANVEMGMTLSGMNSKKRKKKAIEVLERVGLKDHVHKKPNQLSGGQMQRVAIARALATNPSIILADEPTGALDSETSVQIMELIKEIAKDKLVIMVTHNPDLANEYASRVVEFKDGLLVSDSNPYHEEKDKEKLKIVKTSMNFLTALKLSFTNILTKKGRTLITAFASSIGIIGIALILALSNGFDIQIQEFETNALSSLPIMISEQSMDMNPETYQQLSETGLEEYPDENIIYVEKNIEEQVVHYNNISEEYINHIEKLNPDTISGISYNRITGLNILSKNENAILPVSSSLFSVSGKNLTDNINEFNEQYYDLLSGVYPQSYNELFLVVDSTNQVSEDILKALGIDIATEIKFEDIIGKEFKLILNDEWYINNGNYFIMNTDYSSLYESEEAITLTISGIARVKEDKQTMTVGSLLMYNDDLVEEVININKDSKIVLEQNSASYNVLTGEKFDLETEEGIEAKEKMLTYFGANGTPVVINIYPKSFEDKEYVINHLDSYNENKEDEDKVLYTDLADLIAGLSEGIMDAITIVLIAFSSISLIVSSIMIGIITYISVLERTKEIGVLRALGARKKDITRVFNAETIIVGFLSGLLGIGIALLLTVPANIIILALTELENVARLNPLHALILLLISMTLTVVGGFIPAKMASKKDPVIALRTE